MHVRTYTDCRFRQELYSIPGTLYSSHHPPWLMMYQNNLCALPTIHQLFAMKSRLPNSLVEGDILDCFIKLAGYAFLRLEAALLLSE